MGQSHRLAQGGTIDRSRVVGFTFDGRPFQGYQGDTLASALLANGVRLMGRSFKYHRPRGVYSAGVEEMNALMRIGQGNRAEPNTRATTVELTDGLVACSQNRWPSLRFDLRAAHGWIAPFIPAGFYYKTFMWPARFWPRYEKVIRRAAGLGVAPALPDPDRYDKCHAYCDRLIIGAGPAGLAAARAACRAGLRVILVEERASAGGSLAYDRRDIDGQPALAWVAAVLQELAAAPGCRVLTRCTAFGYYDHDTVTLAERCTGHADPGSAAPRTAQRLWTVHAKRVVLATGAIERPLVFGNNDLPGVMLANAVRAYCNHYAVAAGRRVLLYANNSHAYETVFDLAAAGIEVTGVVEARVRIPDALATRLRALGIALYPGARITAATGRGSVSGARILDGEGREHTQACDLIAVSGGWTPSVHLHSQSGAKVVYDESIASFVPGPARQSTISVGGAAGHFSLRASLAEGHAAGGNGASPNSPRSGDQAASPDIPQCEDELPYDVLTAWLTPATDPGKAKRFVDIQDDVTVEDVELAARENFRSVEHLKRYTTLGMGTDQGKTSNVNGLAIMAQLRDEPVSAIGTTTFRPPYTPVTLGLFAGRERGGQFSATRTSPIHAWHLAHGAVMGPAGAWLRPKSYVREGESYTQAWRRECLHVRGKAGIADVSTLGKIDVQGPDAARFLDRVYANAFLSLPVGRARYGLMLREDGPVMDDGTVARWSPNRYFVTTTTANAAAVMSHMEYLLATAWPDLRVRVTSVSDHYAQIALAGPDSRKVLAALLPGEDVSDTALPHMGVRRTQWHGIELNLYRVSYSGERAYELSIPAGYGMALWQDLMRAGAPWDLAPYGTEAMGALRIEKGHVAGPELDGRTTPDDLGMARLASKKRPFVGKRMLERPGLAATDRPVLVGLQCAADETPIPVGAMLVDHAQAGTDTLGWVSSVTFSPSLQRHIALGFVRGGRACMGRVLIAWSPLAERQVKVTVVEPAFLDSAGERLRG